MTAKTHQELVNFIWSICNLLTGQIDVRSAREDETT